MSILTSPHFFIFKFVMNVFNVMLRGGALYKQCFQHPPFQNSVFAFIKMMYYDQMLKYMN